MSSGPQPPYSPIPLPDTERAVLPGARVVGEVDPNEVIELTIRVRPRRPIDDDAVVSLGATLPAERQYMSYEELVDAHGADPQDLERVERFARDAALDVVSADAARRTVVIAGRAAQVRQAFGDVSLKMFSNDLVTYRGRVGPVHVPEHIADVIEGVFGLDNRIQAKSHFTRPPMSVVRARALAQTYLARDLAKLYNFPVGANGAGQCIALLEFGGGFTDADLSAYWSGSGTVPQPVTKAVGVDGVDNTPGDDADTEVLLDIEVAGGVAPGASIVVYFAPFTERGWVDVLLAAVHDRVNRPSVISISWGWAEGFDIWTRQAVAAVNDALKQAAMLGITVCVASGDDGSADDQTDGRVHVDFPAASPFVLACGGTTLFSNAGRITSETTWNRGPRALGGGATGGGVSVMLSPVPWQAAANVPSSPASGRPGRGVPDVSANADGVTGYRIVVNGVWDTVGGTSAAAPLWAGLVALFNQKLGKNAGFINPILYQNGAALRDIVVGSNDTTGRFGAFKARRGWDACTGLGSPNGTALLAVLGGEHGKPAKAAPSDLQWQQVPGAAIDVAVVGQGTLFAIGADTGVYRWNGWAWLNQGACALRIAADAKGTAWIVGADGGVYHQSGTTWKLAGGPAVDVSAGCDGSIWAARLDGSLARLDGETWTTVASDVWRVSAWDAANVWVVQKDGGVAHWDGKSMTARDVQAVDIGAADGLAWAATPQGLVVCRDAGTCEPVAPGVDAIAIAVDAAGLPWVVVRGGSVYAATQVRS